MRNLYIVVCNDLNAPIPISYSKCVVDFALPYEFFIKFTDFGLCVLQAQIVIAAVLDGAAIKSRKAEASLALLVFSKRSIVMRNAWTPTVWWQIRRVAVGPAVTHHNTGAT
jgi:hypothetical protein